MLGNENTDTAMNFVFEEGWTKNRQPTKINIHMVTFAEEVYHAHKTFGSSYKITL